MKLESKGRIPDLVDRHVGSRMRIRRRAVGISQEDMANFIGVTFQQVQKYERGDNRISASKLYRICEVLNVKPSFFFDGLPSTVDEKLSDEISRETHEAMLLFFGTPEGGQLAEIFPRIRQGAVRRQILDLVRTLADEL